MKELLIKNTLLNTEPNGITNGRYWIKEAPNHVIDKMVMKYHYSHKATKNRFLSFSVNNGKGFLQLGYGIRPHIKKTISKYITVSNYCEFDRMWLSDSLPKFAESQVISLLLSYLKQTNRQIVFMITYADGSVGNTGIIYKATNAIYIGKSKLDFYLLKSGERVHPVSMWHRHKTRAMGRLKTFYPNIEHIRNEYQYRFLYILNKSMRKKFLKEQENENR